MRTIEVQELEEHISEVLRHVQEDGESIEVTSKGRSVMLIMPLNQAQREGENIVDWTDIDALRAEIGKYWPEGISAIDAIRDVRREL
jgi:prevent-host-death family protein